MAKELYKQFERDTKYDVLLFLLIIGMAISALYLGSNYVEEQKQTSYQQGHESGLKDGMYIFIDSNKTDWNRVSIHYCSLEEPPIEAGVCQ